MKDFHKELENFESIFADLALSVPQQTKKRAMMYAEKVVRGV